MSSKNGNKLRGGNGALGHTVIDSSFYGRPETGFYTASEMASMGAKVGGSKGQKQRGGNGALGHTVIDSSFYGRPEVGFYTASQMASMGAKVGGANLKELTVYTVEGVSQKKQRGGFAQESKAQNQNRIKGIINNMIDVSDSKDLDIIDVLRNEIKEDGRSKYSKTEAEQMLKEYYLFNPNKTLKTKLGNRQFPSNLLGKYMKSNQTGGNRVTLPITFFTGEIPDKIVVPTYIDNYCAPN
jgi:hypothetical protein